MRKLLKLPKENVSMENGEKMTGKCDEEQPDKEWFASIFLHSLEFEKELKWWRYPSINNGLEIPLCWLLLSIAFFGNFSVLYSDDFAHFFANYTILYHLTMFAYGLFNALAVAGLWTEFQYFLLPILIIYFAFSTVTFVYLLCALPFLVYLDEPSPIYYLLAPLLPLNAFASKSLFEVFLLLRSNAKKQCATTTETRKENLAENEQKSNKQKLWFEFEEKGVEREEEDQQIVGANICDNDKDKPNISQFCGQIAVRKIGSGMNGMNSNWNAKNRVNEKMEESKMKGAKSAAIVQMPNGEVRRRRYKKKKKMGERRTDRGGGGNEKLDESSTAELREIHMEKLIEQNYRENLVMKPTTLLSLSSLRQHFNEDKSLWGHVREAGKNEETKKQQKKPPIPLPRSSRPKTLASVPNWQMATMAFLSSPMSPQTSAASLLPSPIMRTYQHVATSSPVIIVNYTETEV